MSLTHAFNTALQALPSPLGGGQTVAVTAQDCTLRAELTALDSLGCAVRTLIWETDRLADATPAKLTAIGQALAQKVSYLLEPLGPLELDAESCTLQMRSIPPGTDPSGGKSYYELVVTRGGSARLQRYSTLSGNRAPMDAVFTREVLLRLIGDVAQTLT